MLDVICFYNHERMEETLDLMQWNHVKKGNKVPRTDRRLK